MIDWTSSMQQIFEFYIVNPETWSNERPLSTVTSCTITRDATKDTLGSASFDCNELLGECYIRVYLVAIQNGITEKFPLGTFLVQTPSSNFDGLMHKGSLDAYTPLIELKEKPPPIGYSILSGTRLMNLISRVTSENARAPVVSTDTTDIMEVNFISDITDDWLKYLSDAMRSIEFEFGLDEMGRILYNKHQDAESMQPVWTYDDDKSSILYPSISVNRDLYGIPNVVEIIFDGIFVRVINSDPNSPVSTVSRGREIIKRITDPNIIGLATTESLTYYANKILRDLSSLEFTISYTHGYTPTRIGDAIRLNCKSAGFNNIIAKIVSQTITCEPGCPVSETAIFTTNLWG